MPNALLTARKAHPKNAEWRILTVGGKEFIVFAGELADKLELGKPLPNGVTEDPPKFDGALPSLKLPRPGGGGPASWRNTKEAAQFESESIRRHQEIEEERRDRRTALMQAVAIVGADPGANLVRWADSLYAWLRESVSEGPPEKASVRAAGASTRPRAVAQGPPSDTISGRQADPLHSTEEAAPEDRREGDAGDSGVTPGDTAQTLGSPSRRQHCLHTDGIKTITKETGGTVDVCKSCGTVMNL